MPGLTVCGRCGAQLALRSSSLDVHPPRASAGVKRLRRWIPYHRMRGEFSEAAWMLPRSLNPQYDWPGLLRVCLRMVVPGWPQSYQGHRTRGRLIFWAYLLLLLFGLVSVGTNFGATCFGLAIALHLSCIVDVAWGAFGAWRDRIALTLVSAIVVALFVYVPVTAAASQRLLIQRFQANIGRFEAGDVMVVWLTRTPQVGDVVLFNLPVYQINMGRYFGGGNTVYDLRGAPFVDRIVAGPGQHVIWKQHELYVDGQLSSWQPLRPEVIDCDLDFVVPDDHWGILPGVDARGYRLTPQDWVAISCVRRGTVRGRAVLFHRPHWRWSLL